MRPAHDVYSASAGFRARWASTARLVATVGIATLGTAAAGCQEATALRVDVATDVPWADGRSVALSAAIAGNGVDGPASASAAVVPGPWTGRDVGNLVFLPESPAQTPVLVVAVMGVTRPAEQCTTDHPDGCIFARRRLSFVKHRTLDVPIELHASCIGVPCDSSTTCNALGQCVGADVDTQACAEHGADCSLPADSATPPLGDPSADGGPDAKTGPAPPDAGRPPSPVDSGGDSNATGEGGSDGDGKVTCEPLPAVAAASCAPGELNTNADTTVRMRCAEVIQIFVADDAAGTCSEQLMTTLSSGDYQMRNQRGTTYRFRVASTGKLIKEYVLDGTVSQFTFPP